MNRTTFVVLTSVLVVLAACQSTGLTGQVRSPSGPVAAASVALYNAQNQQVESAQTSDSGKFGFKSSLAPGVYVLKVSKSGFATIEKTFEYPSQTGLTLNLIPGISVTGLVNLPEGQRAIEARVTFRRDEEMVIDTLTDASGRYRADGLEAGSYEIAVVSSDGYYDAKLELTLNANAQLIDNDIPLTRAPLQLDGSDGEVEDTRVLLDPNKPIGN